VDGPLIGPWAAPPALPGYQALEIIGQGGFGTVYRARQLAVGREVALKIDQRVLATERDQRRFVREVTAAGQLSGHPHVVDVYDAGVLPDGRPYLVLELCPNGSLWDRVHADGPLPVGEVRDVGVGIADALAAAHAAGVLHRDVKPQNILITRYGMAALADFGLAAMPRPGAQLSATRESLTPAYASPEAFRLAEPTAAGDVYALGATLYALLAGRPPRFPASGELDIATIVALHREPVPDVVGVPPELVAVCRRAMAYEHADRPDAATLRDELAALVLPQTRPSRAAVPPVQPGVAPWPTPDPAARVTGAWPGPSAQASGRSPDQAVGRSPDQAVARSGQAPPAVRSGRPPDQVAPRPEPAAPGAAAPARSRAARHQGGRRRGVAALALAAAGLAAAGVAVVVLLVVRGPGPPTASPTNPVAPTSPAGPALDRFGTRTAADDCPAAGVEGVQARCTEVAECWSGPVFVVGRLNVDQRQCGEDHVWETFAIALLPPDVAEPDEGVLSRHATVRKVCSEEVMMASRLADARRILPQDGWELAVFPPTEEQWDDGLRVFRCVGRPGDSDVLAGAVFRPRGPSDRGGATGGVEQPGG
jgi:hypothetical protein